MKKVLFFKRLKNAIINFDEYINFLEEKLSIAVKYIIKLVFIFAVIITISLTYKTVKEFNNLIISFEENAPEFRFQDEKLVIEGERQKIIKGDQDGYIGLIVDTQNENLKDIEESTNYERIIAFLKDKIVVKDAEGLETNLAYNKLSEDYNLNNINKHTILEFLSGNNKTKIYFVFSITMFILFFTIYAIQLLIDILLLSIVGYLVSKIAGIKLKYKSIFNISTYSITLSAILYLIYMIINLYTGFTVKYFEIAYNGIAYIYITTAILMIKSDLIKQQIEVGKIIEEQKKVREERQQKEEEKDKKEETKKEKKEKKEEKEEGTPEGNQA